MPIGRFARLTRLSIRALRRYDAEDLLAPACVDPDTGYRYYALEQVPAATTIALLRSLDVPLATVRGVLAAGGDPAALAAVLAVERDRAARELTEREQALRSIERLAREPATVRYDVAVADERPRRLVGLRAPARADRIAQDTGALCRQVAALLGAAGHGAVLAAGLVALFPLDLEDTFAITAGGVLPRTAKVPPGAVEAELVAGRWASTLHVGPFVELPLAYAALFEHLRERGHDAVPPVTETYLTDPTDTPPAQLATRLAVRLAG